MAITRKMGTQIIYVPTHAKGDTSHSDSEPGFVISTPYEDATFCKAMACNPDTIVTRIEFKYLWQVLRRGDIFDEGA